VHDDGRTRRLGLALPACADSVGMLSVYYTILSNKIYKYFPLYIRITYMLQAYMSSFVDINTFRISTTAVIVI